MNFLQNLVKVNINANSNLEKVDFSTSFFRKKTPEKPGPH
jgi:DNA-binding protein YbaB